MNGDSRQKEHSHAGALAARPGLAWRLAFKRATAKLTLFGERLLPTLIVPGSIAAVFVALAWFGLFRIMPDWARLATVAALGIGFLVSLRSLFRIEWPDARAADRHLESRNGLAHQPVAVQEDRPANDSPFARALWREHQIRMAERISALDAGLPRPDLSRFDRNGLRALPVLLLAAAFGFSFSNGAGRLVDAFAPSGVGGVVDPGLRIDAWVTPPAYTGRAPVYLTARAEAGSGPAEVPQGSELTVRVAGAGGGETLLFTPAAGGEAAVLEAAASPAKPAAGDAAKDGARSYGMALQEDGVLSVNGQNWAFTVIPDKPPEIAFDAAPRISVNGALEIGFMARDDYGVQAARAEIEPAEEPLPGVKALFPAPDYKLDLPRRGNATVKGLTSRNLTEHPLSGTRVRITLVAADATGQEGRSAPYEMVMPARRFYEPLAASVAEERRIFSLNTAALPRAIALNEALALRPDETIPNLKHFLLIRSALGRMQTARGEEDLKGAAEHLWEIALGLEDGDLSLAERQMRDAQKALADALERGASEEEIARLTAELRRAMEQYLSELARQMQQNPRMQGRMAENTLRQQDLNRMLDQIENLARSGNRDAAQQLLSELQRMMNNLQAGRPNQRGGQQDSSPMRQQIDRLGELMQEQQRLMDETFRLDKQLQDRMMQNDELGEDGDLFEGQQQQQQQGQNGGEQQQQGQQGGPNGEMTEQQLRDALKQLRERQDALGRKLQELQKGLADMGIKPGQGFGDAGKEMKGAGEALGEGEGGRAVEGQGRALEALRRGARDMMNQMMQAMQQGQGQQQGQGPGMVGEGNQNGRDPLGRPRASSGPEFGDQVKVPDEIDVQRARQILESIREKLSNGLGGEIERRYLERLLDLQ